MKDVKLTDGTINVVEDRHYDLIISEGPWTNIGGRAAKFKQGKLIYLIDLILPPVPGKVRDHINGDQSDNRASNLRYLEHWQNIQNRGLQKNNTTGFIGVRWSNSANGYQSSIQVNGKRIYFGTFESAEEAAMARDAYVKANLLGIAKLNFPNS